MGTKCCRGGFGLVGQNGRQNRPVVPNGRPPQPCDFSEIEIALPEGTGYSTVSRMVCTSINDSRRISWRQAIDDSGRPAAWPQDVLLNFSFTPFVCIVQQFCTGCSRQSASSCV